MSAHFSISSPCPYDIVGPGCQAQCTELKSPTAIERGGGIHLGSGPTAVGSCGALYAFKKIIPLITTQQ